MLGNYRVSKQLRISRVLLSSMELRVVIGRWMGPIAGLDDVGLELRNLGHPTRAIGCHVSTLCNSLLASCLQLHLHRCSEQRETGSLSVYPRGKAVSLSCKCRLYVKIFIMCFLFREYIGETCKLGQSYWRPCFIRLHREALILSRTALTAPQDYHLEVLTAMAMRSSAFWEVQTVKRL
jgi:hypothetical protein